MRTIEQVNADIAAVEADLQAVSGTATEVYARIVGYYRSVRNWNKGKREEFTQRKMFSDTNPRIQGYTAAMPSSAGESEQCAAFLEVYTRKTCPNCPPVKNYCSMLPLPVQYVDADTDEGLRSAAERQIRSCPTVIAYTEHGAEIARAYSVADLQAAAWLPDTAQAVTA